MVRLPKTDHPVFILASTSARRQEFAKLFGVQFKIVAPDFDEEAVDPADFPNLIEYVKTLAVGKALSVSLQFPDQLILGSDTIVVCEGQLYNKPQNRAHAKQIWQHLLGTPQEVYTAVALVKNSEVLQLEVEKSGVLFRKMTDQEIEKYLDTGEYIGKAGGYGIQGEAKKFVEKIDGSLTNVLGLPVQLVKQMFEQQGIPVRANTSELVFKLFQYRE